MTDGMTLTSLSVGFLYCSVNTISVNSESYMYSVAGSAENEKY